MENRTPIVRLSGISLLAGLGLFRLVHHVSSLRGAASLVLFGIVILVLLVFALYGTRVLLKSQNYSRADRILELLMGLAVAGFILLMLDMSIGRGITRSGLVSGSGNMFLQIMILSVYAGVMVLLVLLGLRFVNYGRRSGWLWIATGLAMLVAMIASILAILVVIVGYVESLLGVFVVGFFIVRIAELVGLVALILWGVALIMDSRKADEAVEGSAAPG